MELLPARQLNIMQSAMAANSNPQIGVDSLFIYLLSFGLLLHIKKKEKKRKQKKQKKQNKKTKQKTKTKTKTKTDSKTKQNGQGSRYSLANYSGPLRYN